MNVQEHAKNAFLNARLAYGVHNFHYRILAHVRHLQLEELQISQILLWVFVFFTALLQYMKDSCHLILAGDKPQLHFLHHDHFFK